MNGVTDVTGDIFSNCATCARLWREYADATMALFRLASKQNIAALQHDHQTVIMLETQVATADSDRRDARESIATHEDEHRSP